MFADVCVCVCVCVWQTGPSGQGLLCMSIWPLKGCSLSHHSSMKERERERAKERDSPLLPPPEAWTLSWPLCVTQARLAEASPPPPPPALPFSSSSSLYLPFSLVHPVSYLIVNVCLLFIARYCLYRSIPPPSLLLYLSIALSFSCAL